MTLHQGGATRMYELALEKTQPALLSTFSGDRRFSRFGSVLHLTDLDDDGLGEVGIVSAAKVTPFIPSGPVSQLDGHGSAL